MCRLQGNMDMIMFIVLICLELSFGQHANNSDGTTNTTMSYMNGTDMGDMGHMHGTDMDDMGHMNGTDMYDMGHMNGTDIADMGHMNVTDMYDMGHMNGTDIADMGHMNGTDMGDMGHMNGADIGDMGHMNGTDTGDMGHMSGTDGMDHNHDTDQAGMHDDTVTTCDMDHTLGGMDEMDPTMDHEIDHEMDHDIDTNMDHSASGHSTYFWAGNKVQLLFEKLATDDDKSIGLSVLYVCLVAIFSEGLKAFRKLITKEELKQQHPSGYKYDLDGTKVSGCYRRFVLHLLQVFLHMIQVFVSLCLMLVFMTFNAWLCAAVIGGAGVGYLLFGAYRPSFDDNIEGTCH